MKLWYFIVVLLAIEKNAILAYSEIFSEKIFSEINGNLSIPCQVSLSALIPQKKLLLLMIDASSRIPPGISNGNIISMGNYDVCMAINEGPIKGKFCKASLNTSWLFKGKTPPHGRINTEVMGVRNTLPNLGLNLYFCVPDTCTSQDLNVIFDKIAIFEDNKCLTQEEQNPKLDALAIVAIVIFAIIGIVTVLSTLCDIYLICVRCESPNVALTSFSLYSNGKKLFKLGGSQQLMCLNGIKSLSMIWVVLGHVYMAYVFVPLDNYIDIYNWLDSARSQYIAGATVSVDTFLLIGGFLTVYSFQKTMETGKKFNIPMYYFHRYLRLAPAVAAMVLAHVALFNYFGSGPVWGNTDTFLVAGCKKYWWSSLLFIQNYVNPSAICIPQSWYLSVDMQLFLVSPLLLVLMRQWPFWGYITLSTISILSIVASFLIGWFYELSGQMTANTAGNLTDYMDYYYMPTHTRMVPYLVGLMLGYAIYKLKNSGKKLQIDKIWIISGWIISLALLATCIYSGNSLQFTKYNRLANSFFIAFMRPTWALAVSWVIFACVMDYGGLINDFLSLPVFQILSRLSYSIYLVHYAFIFMTNFNTRSSLHFSDFNAFHKFWGDFAFTLAISVGWTLIFESPIIKLESLLLGGKSEPEKSKNPLV